MTFNPDGMYLWEQYVFGNYIFDASGKFLSGTGNYQEETGTFVDDGSAITFSPTVSSCPGADPPYTLTYTTDGTNLLLDRPEGTATYAPEDTSVSAPGTAIVEIVTGCFAADGSFTSGVPASVN